jgi:hypothetical protein
MYIRFLVLCFMFLFSGAIAAQKGGYAYMRVWDCNRSVSSGSGFMDAQILITYETGETEKIDLEPFNEKSEPENLKVITETLNKMRQRGYTLISNTATGEQGNMVMDYIFLKPN